MTDDEVKRRDYRVNWGVEPPDEPDFSDFILEPTFDQLQALLKHYAISAQNTGVRTFLRHHRKHPLLFAKIGIACTSCPAKWRRA